MFEKEAIESKSIIDNTLMCKSANGLLHVHNRIKLMYFQCSNNIQL